MHVSNTDAVRSRFPRVCVRASPGVAYPRGLPYIHTLTLQWKDQLMRLRCGYSLMHIITQRLRSTIQTVQLCH